LRRGLNISLRLLGSGLKQGIALLNLVLRSLTGTFFCNTLETYLSTTVNPEMLTNAVSNVNLVHFPLKCHSMHGCMYSQYLWGLSGGMAMDNLQIK
jgi:hypothetical protein